MGDVDIDKVVKKTQDTLGKFVKKPPLTEKLLKKPPFRFLHDIFTELIRSSGYMKGLYGDSEMVSANVKEKDSKIAFLQKAIDVTVMVTGEQCSVRPSKVVAGHEPEKTNELLQLMAKAIKNKMNSDEAVQRVLNGEKPGSGKPPTGKKGDKSEHRSRDKDKDKDRRRHHEKDKEDKKGSGSRDRAKERSKDRSRSADKREKEERREKKDREKENEGGKDRKDRQRKEEEREEKSSEKKETPSEPDKAAGGEQEEEEGEQVASRIPRPSSAKGQRRRHAREGDGSDGEADQTPDTQGDAGHAEMNGEVNGTDELPPQVIASRKIPRPGSARPAAPRRTRRPEPQEDPSARIGSGKQVASVIIDDGGNSDDDDDDETFVVEDSGPVPPEMEPLEPTSGEVADDGEHGGLVRKILETKKELEGQPKSSHKKEPEKPLVSDAAWRKEREMVSKEVEKLRAAIQVLCRSANPLGKVMDYVQEDMDAMQKELEVWRKENKELDMAIKREQSITNSEVEPLKAQLSELDQAMADQLDQIAAVKANIMRNDDKINKMMASMNFASRT
ncbi:PREDICTED: TRAF3-interacting protein 1-like isoform X2 [Branchiostoma belcheri]|uniref:TRAF3-interacting protein 1 n=1 Tax=Branchiostoma belcheri TaxID=7741 RepID=A0A6P4XU75_BRABE|nr:PREDICTED: TRAF3-interacting protein 1-like isoform X2 [Branchiostoma belcheri]KAI8521314.1 TRAF3-interacting protein 1 [Branchiostoma belcheri]